MGTDREAMRKALQNLADAFHQGRATHAQPESSGYVQSLVDAAEEALAAPEPPRGTDAQILKERELTASAIDGAMAFGYLNINPAPDGDWLAPWWKKGRDAAQAEGKLLVVVKAAKAVAWYDWTPCDSDCDRDMGALRAALDDLEGK